MLGFGFAGSCLLTSALVLGTFQLSEAKIIQDLGTTTVDEVNFEIAEELAGHIPQQRISALEAVLGSVYKTLPKNSFGRVGHQTVKYALHRLFVKRHGWYIKGLEPSAESTSMSGAAWIPSYLQNKLEEHMGKNGMDLHELASVGAALEDLIRKEAGKRMKDVYEVLQFSTTEPISMASASDALDTYAMAYLLSGRSKNVTISGPRDIRRKRHIFAEKYRNFSEFHAWFDTLEQQHLNIHSQTEVVGFNAMTRLAEDFGERYGTFNDVECRALKNALLAVEGKGRGVGRVRLSDFYNMSRYSHWKLNERVEYLRDLGALDESNSSNPMVIVPNYITSLPNCLEATPLYSVCCRDECEDLLGRLERDLKEPTASAAKIASLIASYPSDTVSAPRELSQNVLQRLDDIAALHGGSIDVHGRLFAQWMHHVFPRECPYPHEAGSTNPQTADEWMKSNGHQSEQANEEEVQKVLDGACSATMSDEGELPWSSTEEFLDRKQHSNTTLWLGVLLCVLGIVGLVLLQTAKHTGCLDEFGISEKQAHVGACSSAMALVLGAAILDLVDKIVVLAVVIAGAALEALRQYCVPSPSTASKCACMQDKLV